MTAVLRPSLGDRLTSPFAILAIAALLRLAFLIVLGNRTYWADTLEYEKAAMQFLLGHGPEGGTPRAPLYPLLMALGFKLGGVANYQAIRIIQLILSLLLIHLTGVLAKRTAGPDVQRLTMVAMSVSPTLVFTSNMLYPTVLYSLLLLSVTLTAWRLVDRPTKMDAALLGAGLTLGWLTDQVFIAPAFAVLLWLGWHVRRVGAPLARAIVLALVVSGSLAVPYLRWQQEAYGGKAVFMQKAQYVLHWSRSDSLMASSRQVQLPPNHAFRPLGAREFVDQESALLRTQPLAYVHDVAFEFLHFFAPMPDRVQTQNRFNRGPVLGLGAAYTGPLLLLALFGALRGRAAVRHRLLFALVVLTTAAFYSLFFSQTRYRIPVEPQICLLAALGVARLLPDKQKHTS